MLARGDARTNACVPPRTARGGHPVSDRSVGALLLGPARRRPRSGLPRHHRLHPPLRAVRRRAAARGKAAAVVALRGAGGAVHRSAQRERLPPHQLALRGPVAGRGGALGIAPRLPRRRARAAPSRAQAGAEPRGRRAGRRRVCVLGLRHLAAVRWELLLGYLAAALGQLLLARKLGLSLAAAALAAVVFAFSGYAISLRCVGNCSSATSPPRSGSSFSRASWG